MTICLILGWKVRKTFGEVWQQGLLVCRPGLLKTATQATQATQAHVKQSNPSWPVTFALQHPSAAAKRQNYCDLKCMAAKFPKPSQTSAVYCMYSIAQHDAPCCKVQAN